MCLHRARNLKRARKTMSFILRCLRRVCIYYNIITGTRRVDLTQYYRYRIVYNYLTLKGTIRVVVNRRMCIRIKQVQMLL